MPKRSVDPLALERLRNQRLIGSALAKPEEVVSWLGAMQAQDYAGAKWAIAQRTRACTDADVEAALTRGAILRTHVLRPTWHFVTPADIRSFLALTAPRLRAQLGYYDKQLEIDAPLLRKSRAVLEKVLADGHALTRSELAVHLGRAGIRAVGQRLGHLMMHAEVAAVVCSGPRRGKHSTYALLDERAPAAGGFLSGDEALAELARRYFFSHGPALASDFAWWSGLTMREAERGIAMAELVHEVVGRKTFWRGSPPRQERAQAPVFHLLPNYDEHLVAYKDRSAAYAPGVKPTGERDGVFANQVVRDGLVLGGWSRVVSRRGVAVETKVRLELSAKERKTLTAATQRYARYLGLPIAAS